jgi:hypothetical protein
MAGNRAVEPIPDSGGGGAYCADGAGLVNCVVARNEAAWNGGGVLCAENGAVVNCTVCDNSAANEGGGIYGLAGTSNRNAILYFNQSPVPPFDYAGTGLAFDFCCLGEDPGIGTGNVVLAPEFVDRAGGDYRLAQGASCIDVGTDVNAPEMDRRGVPRPLDGDGVPPALYDIGAYEFAHPFLDSDLDGMPDGWEADNGLNPLVATGDDGAQGDPDRDGASNLKEYQHGTDPLDPQSRPADDGSVYRLR